MPSSELPGQNLVELKAGCVYAGKRKEGRRGVRGNVAPFATAGTAEETRAGMRAAIDVGYNVADIEAVHCASGGGGRRIDSGLDDLGGSVEQGLDLYHAMKHVRKAFPEGASRAHLVSPALKRRPEAFVCAIDRMMPKAADARRRERMRECRDHVANHADLLRGGGSLDTMESANAYVRAKRTKSSECAQSRARANVPRPEGAAFARPNGGPASPSVSIRPKRYDPGTAWPGACLQGLGSLPWFHAKSPVRPTCSLPHVGSAPVKVTHTGSRQAIRIGYRWYILNGG